MEKLDIKNLEKLLKAEPSEKLLLRAIKGLKVEKKDIKSRCILVFICLILGTAVGIHKDTVIIFRDNVDTILNILLALFGVIFTGYSLLQAFMNKKMLLQLLEDTKVDENGEEKSRLQDINENFVYLMLLQVVGIMTALIIKIVLLCVADNFTLFMSIIINNIIAMGLISAYFIFIGIILWRTVSFVSSIFQLFNIYAVTRVLEMIDEEEKQ
nr:MAG TPA: Protein of unknown function (DUF3169) [Caudoviricetes sp.]